MSSQTCPRCGSEVDGLQTLSEPIRAQLEGRNNEDIPAQICMNCYRQLASGEGASADLAPGSSAGSVLVAQEKAKEQRKLMLWKSRVSLVKKARLLMGEKAFSEAAVAYEKYLRVLEVVFDAKPGELQPEHFKDSARTQELTVVASVYWDLFRIYDTSEKYGDRQHLAAKKLSQFLKFTPIYPDIIRRATTFAKTAKNPNLVKSFVKTASETKGRCFIASSAFDSAEAPEVVALRIWRDQVLAKQPLGLGFIHLYESTSPPLARWLDRNPQFKPVIRKTLQSLVRRLNTKT